MVHLHVHSWFSFLEGASSPADLAATAASHGQPALALTDSHSVAGVVQFAGACKANGIKPIFGATIIVDGYPLVLLAANHEGYANLCDLLTLAHYDRENIGIKSYDFHSENLHDRTGGLLCLTGDRQGRLSALCQRGDYRAANDWLLTLSELFPLRVFVELCHHERPDDPLLVHVLSEGARKHGLYCIVTNAVRHAHARGYAWHDALTCARLGLTITQPHLLRPVNDAAYLCREADLRARGLPPNAIANAKAIAGLCDVELLPGEVTPPVAHIPQGIPPLNYLRDLCRQGMKKRYPHARSKLWQQAAQTLRHETNIIAELGLEEFFLVVREVIEFARSRGIRCSGRGSAANSVVAYLLGITEVDPVRHHLLFERFLHAGRKEMPDIDVDFETHRREEVIAWMEERFGPAHTAMTANVVTFRLRLAVREMAKVLGYPLWQIDKLGKVLPPTSARKVRAYRDDIAAVLGESPLLEILLGLVEQLHDCPRHLSLHSGGMILSRQPLRYLSPVQCSANGVRQVQFSKDDVEALGLIKFDVLGLRMLSVVTEAVELLRADGEAAPDVDNLPLSDEPTFELIRAGRTMSVFQIESPGQWNLLSRTQPREFDDLIAQVALFRPGPLQGNMVNPYVQRRRGLAPVTYPHPSLEPVLKDTYGVILFQEQVLEIAHAFAGLSLAEADEFRRLMSKFRDAEEMEGMRAQFVGGAIKKHGVTALLANSVFDAVAKFVGYGFCRSHAAAFARTVYQTAYLKAHHPAAFMAAVMEHKPGFYPLNTILEEARHCGVRVLSVDIHRSDVKYRLETGAIRLPFTQVQGLSAEPAAALVLARLELPFRGIEDCYRRVRLPRDVWNNLARAGAFTAFGARRDVLWQLGDLARRIGTSGQEQQALDETVFRLDEVPQLHQLTPAESAVWDFQTTGVTAGPHPIAMRRPHLARLGATPIRDLTSQRPGGRVLAAGAVISRQRPPTAKGMTFLLLEDETGRLPTAITPPVYEKYRTKVRSSGLLIEGRLESAGPGQSGVYRSVLIQRLWPLEEALGGYRGHPRETVH
jgi:error-prone DNA polymerase